MAFNGKLIELKTIVNGTTTWVELPMKYVKAESYNITPDQRMESSANRASTGLLKRVTVSHTASKIEIETVALTNKEVKILSDLFSAAFTNALERKLDIRYYHPETDGYKTATVYMPDTPFPIDRIDRTNKVVHYNSVRYAFIEY